SRDWSSDVCSSDLAAAGSAANAATDAAMAEHLATIEASEDAAAASATAAAASETAATLAASTGIVKGYATKADMDADLAHDEGTLALVTNDSTAANNGTYRKSGGSGTGSWVKSADRVTELEGGVAALESFQS